MHARGLETVVFFHTLTDLRRRGFCFGVHFLQKPPKIRQIRIHCNTQGMFNVSIPYSQGRQDSRLPCFTMLQCLRRADANTQLPCCSKSRLATERQTVVHVFGFFVCVLVLLQTFVTWLFASLGRGYFNVHHAHHVQHIALSLRVFAV